MHTRLRRAIHVHLLMGPVINVNTWIRNTVGTN